MTGSKSNKEFKHDVIRISNLGNKLKESKFDINKFWIKHDSENYSEVQNEAEKIKLVKGGDI